MADLEAMLYKICEEFSPSAVLQLKVRGVEERPEYGDKIIKRTYILTVNYDLVMPIDEEYQSSNQSTRKLE